MPDLSKRSNEKELLDDPSVPFKDIRQNMQELNTINTLLGGHAITKKGFEKIIGNRKEISVCEIGCGGGDNLLVIQQWCKKMALKPGLWGLILTHIALNLPKNSMEIWGLNLFAAITKTLRCFLIYCSAPCFAIILPMKSLLQCCNGCGNIVKQASLLMTSTGIPWPGGVLKY